MKNSSYHRRVGKSLLITLLALSGVLQVASAGVIFSASSATINSGGPGSGSINDTFNQNGLLSTYVSNVTDFDTYIATNPQHSNIFSGYEWFSNFPGTTASVTYDFGSVRSFDAVALWNEESSGVGLLTLLSSVDNVSFTPLATGLTPTDHPVTNYSADVFAVGGTGQYIRFDMSGCPQQPSNYDACAIGEVAFRESQVPEPGSLALFAVALLGLVATRKSKQG